VTTTLRGIRNPVFLSKNFQAIVWKPKGLSQTPLATLLLYFSFPQEATPKGVALSR